MNENGGPEPRLPEDKPLLGKLLPWLVLLLAALALFYFLNRGCAGTGRNVQDEAIGDGNPTSDSTISGVVKDNTDIEASKEVKPVSSPNDTKPVSAGGSFLEQMEKQLASGEANPNQPLILDYGDFQGRSAIFTSQSEKELEHFVSLLKKYPQARIRIEAHTDNSGNADINMQLSTQQALAVRTFLQDRGIGMERISSFGRGQTKPLASNDTDAGKAKNLRIEIYLTEMR